MREPFKALSSEHLPGEGREVVLLDGVLRRDDDGGSPVADPARAPRCHHAALLIVKLYVEEFQILLKKYLFEDCGQFGEALDGGLWLWVLVGLHRHLRLLHLDLDRGDLIL